MNRTWSGMVWQVSRGQVPAAAAAQLVFKPNLFPLVRTYLGQWAIVYTESSPSPF